MLHNITSLLMHYALILKNHIFNIKIIHIKKEKRYSHPTIYFTTTTFDGRK